MKNGLNMSTSEEIKKIAREYAESVSYGDAEDPNIQIEYDVALPILEWLCKDYCIVPRSKLQEIDNIVCGTFSIGNIAVRQSWEYVKRKLFE